MFQNLGEFLSALDRAGEVKRITQKVSPFIEISKITDRESKSPGGGNNGELTEPGPSSEF